MLVKPYIWPRTTQRGLPHIATISRTSHRGPPPPLKCRHLTDRLQRSTPLQRGTPLRAVRRDVFPRRYKPRPGGRPQSAASGLFIALVIQIPAVTALPQPPLLNIFLLQNSNKEFCTAYSVLLTRSPHGWAASVQQVPLIMKSLCVHLVFWTAQKTRERVDDASHSALILHYALDNA